MTHSNVIHGRVRSEAAAETDDEEGVFGLTVHAIDSDHQFDDDLGRTGTLEDGSFDLAFDPSILDANEPHEDTPQIYLRVLDRDGRVLHVDEEARPLPIDDAEITLAATDLENHFARPLTWDLPSGPIVPEEWSAVVDRAIDRTLADRGTEMHAMLLRRAKCPNPDFLEEKEILEHAKGAAEGDPTPTETYRRELDALAEDRSVDPGEDYFSGSWRERVGTRMAERAVAFSHLREQDETLSAGPISREVPLRTCAGFDPDADTVRRLAANGTGLPGTPGEGLAASLSAATDELREYPSAIDPVAGRTLLAGAVNAAADAERRRQYVAAVFDVLGTSGVSRHLRRRSAGSRRGGRRHGTQGDDRPR